MLLKDEQFLALTEIAKKIAFSITSEDLSIDHYLCALKVPSKELSIKDYLIGLSDHTLGTIVPSASILYGASAIEKHYTFDKTLPHSADHWLSLNESELNLMVNQIQYLVNYNMVFLLVL